MVLYLLKVVMRLVIWQVLHHLFYIPNRHGSNISYVCYFMHLGIHKDERIYFTELPLYYPKEHISLYLFYNFEITYYEVVYNTITCS